MIAKISTATSIAWFLAWLVAMAVGMPKLLARYPDEFGFLFPFVLVGTVTVLILGQVVLGKFTAQFSRDVQTQKRAVIAAVSAFEHFYAVNQHSQILSPRPAISSYEQYLLTTDTRAFVTAGGSENGELATSSTTADATTQEYSLGAVA